MAEVVSSYQQGAFTTPINDTVNDATEVLVNDNAVRTKHNSHDADAGVHVQSSILASRPSAGVAGRKWVTVDTGVARVFYDTGVAWVEIDYLRTSATSVAQNFSFGGNLAVVGTLGVTGKTTVVNQDVTGTITIKTGGSMVTEVGSTFNVLGDVSVSGDYLTSAGDFIATLGQFTGSGAGLTNVPSSSLVGALPAISGAALTALTSSALSGALPAVSGAALTALNASNISAGTLANARLPAVMSGLTSISVSSVISPLLGTAGVRFQLDPADTVWFNAPTGGPFSWMSAVAPLGGGTAQYLIVNLAGTAYKILCTTVA